MSELPGNPDDPAFIFFPELVDLQGVTEPARIGEHALLCRAPEQTRINIRSILEPHLSTRRYGNVSPWEFDEISDAQGGTRFSPIIDPEKHQFWVIFHWRKLFDQQLGSALELADPGFLPIISLVRTGGHSGIIDDHAILNWLHENWTAQRRVVGAAQISGIERAWNLLIDFETSEDPSFAFIKTAINDFSALKRVWPGAPLYVIGLFAIIEMLLTTQQDKTTENSLSHQLKEKLTLFANRFSEPLVLTDFFPRASQMSLKTVVSKVYGYRSKVAHGAVVNFASGDLQVLESHRAICDFLRAVVRKLILQAVIEPSLIRDLKTC